MTTTIYIAPAPTDAGTQCHIYALDGTPARGARDHYRDHPDLWREVGLMNSRGRLVCFDGPDDQRQELIDCQPLMAGTTFTFTNGVQ